MFHDYDLSCTGHSDQIVICSPEVFAKFQNLPYPHPFLYSDEAPEAIGILYTSGYYACGTSAMQVFGSADSSRPRSSPTVRTSDVGAEEMGNEKVVKAPESLLHEDLHGKEVSVTCLDSRQYIRERIWLKISQISEVTYALCAVSQKHKDELKEPLKSDKVQRRCRSCDCLRPRLCALWRS